MIRTIFKSILDINSLKTKSKLIVIMSDDWGSIRVPSVDVRKALIAAGFSMTTNRFNKYDCLESNTDLEQLFEVLEKHKDCKGNHPVITALTNVSNPDFEAIQANGFSNYVYESFVDSHKRYDSHGRVLELYHEGIAKGIFIPEFHGREHLNVTRWMNALQQQHPKVHQAFKHHFFFMDSVDLQPEITKGFGAAFEVVSKNDCQKHKEIITEGLLLFEEIFQYKARLFTAPSQIYSTALNGVLAQNGITLLDLPAFQKQKIPGNSVLSKFNYIGKTTHYHQKVIVRNAMFEPNEKETTDGVDTCLQSIEKAFNQNKPAIISNHRAAFVGGIEGENRMKGLKALDKLIASILKKWPDVEFISARDLNKLLC